MSAALQALAYSHICFILNSYLPTFLKLYHRLMLGLSFSDLVMSSSYYFSSWDVPKGTDGVFSPLGNTATCNAQAFFMQYGVSTSIYNVAFHFISSLLFGFSGRRENVLSMKNGFMVVISSSSSNVILHILWACFTMIATSNAQYALFQFL